MAIEDNTTGLRDILEQARSLPSGGSYDDTELRERIATIEGKEAGWNAKGTYSKPSGGIPKTDLASAVQTSLGKADTALQEHQDISGKADKAQIKTFVITEDMVDVVYNPTKGVAPYLTNTGHTDITIHEDAGIEWVEGGQYVFIQDTKIAPTSTYNNVRIRIGNNGRWIPIRDMNSVIAATYAFTRSYNYAWIYKTTIDPEGSLHKPSGPTADTYQRTYRTATNVELPLAGASTGSTTSAWSDPSDGSYKDAYGTIPSDASKRPTINPSTGRVTMPLASVTSDPVNDTDVANKAYVDGKADKPTIATTLPTTLVANTYYNLGTITGSKTIALPSSRTATDEFMIQFTTSTTAPTITWPSGVTWLGGAPTIKASKTYQVSIMNNLGVIAEF